MAQKKKKLTPVMQQYAEAKSAYPDAILFFRLGDFYEMFHEDAVLVSELLGITLTSRNKGAMDEVPMAGVPYHACDGYMAKLLALGHKVALCEQIGDPSKIKGIVPRKVVRVVTPALQTDASQLEATSNHFLATVDGPDAAGKHGVALLDLSTGELRATSVDDRASLSAELVRAQAREVLLPGEMPDLWKLLELSLPKAHVRTDPPLEEAEPVIAASLDEAVVADAREHLDPPALRAVARAVRFAAACMPEAELPIRRIAPIELASTLRIDETAQAHLELVQSTDGQRETSLLGVIDHTVTAFGARLLRRRMLAPLLDVEAIRRRQDAVEALIVHSRAREELQAALKRVPDLERLSVRVELGEATPRDLGRLRDGLLAAPVARDALRAIPDASVVGLLGADVDVLQDLGQALERALVESPPATPHAGKIIRDGYDEALDRLRAVQSSGNEQILALEAKLREEAKIPSLRVKFTRVFGWYVEVTKSHLGKVPKHFRRKQTVAGGERFSLPELDALAEEIGSAEERAKDREQGLFGELREGAAKAYERLRELARKLASWDVSAGLAEAAHRFDYVRPTIDGGHELRIEGGRHPVVERFTGRGRFVPNDTELDPDGKCLWLVTGPNMAGKSTLMRQVALVVVLAQIGSYVPAASAHIGVVDRILSRVGASDNVARGESTFMVEMRETASILRSASRRSLVIVDEIGRGTSTYDGLAIAWAVAEHLHDAIGCRALFATHYHELTELSNLRDGIENVSVSAREHDGDIVFLHTLNRGPASRSYGVAVARLAGLPEPVLANAQAILSRLEDRRPPASTKGAKKRNDDQLDLFATRRSAPDDAVLEKIRAVDPNRMTPLEALAFLASLREQVEPR